jgi:glycosyltransferase involved in cell wall biosynthesis
MRPPRFSIVTPSLNQAEFLERTIRSVLDQDYSDLEYFVMDGGSTDRSAEIIRRHESRLAGWACEPDQGQAHAIEKGFARSTGAVLAYLNSDDAYRPGALRAAAEAFQAHPEADLIYGDVVFVDAAGRPLVLDVLPRFSRSDLWRVCVIPQPAAFWRRRLWESVGGFNREFTFAFDYDFFLRAATLGRFLHVPRLMAEFRYHAAAKSTRARETWAAEDRILRERALGREEWNLADRLRLKWLTARQIAAIAARRARGEKFPCLTPARWTRLARRKLDAPRL